MGRVSKVQSAEHRKTIVEAAARLFRQRGLAAVNIADIMAEAGLTHGGFYGHFSSKEALAVEAIALSFEQVERAWSSLASGKGVPDFELLAEAYLCSPHGNKCPMPALAFEVASSPPDSPIRLVYFQGVGRLADMMVRQGTDEKGLALLAALVGARLLGLAVRDEALTARINAAVIAMARG